MMNQSLPIRSLLAKSGPLSQNLYDELVNPSNNLHKLVKLFKRHGYNLRLCGGAVRDLLLAQKPKDIDLATDATPQEIKILLQNHHIRLINSDEDSNTFKHGTVMCRLNKNDHGENFEITTLRIDTKPDGRHSLVEFCKDWSLDAERRDLTINSMFIDLDSDMLIDYNNGLSDLRKRRIRFVGNAEQRIQEDYLRILRFFKYLLKVGQEFTNLEKDNKEIFDIIKINAKGLEKISHERIWSEIKQIIVLDHAPEVVKWMEFCQVFKYIKYPQPIDLFCFEKLHKSSLDLCPQICTFLMALLPKNIDNKEQLKYLKFPNNLISSICFLNQNFDEFSKLPQDGQDRAIFMELKIALSPKSQRHATKFNLKELCILLNDRNSFEYIKKFHYPDMPIKGNDILACLTNKSNFDDHDIPLGKNRISNLMENVQKHWVHGRYKNSRDELLDYIQEIIRNES